MPGFLKTHAYPVAAAEACRRAGVLIRHGLTVPRAIGGPCGRDVWFDRIEGETGASLAAGDLSPLLSVVAALHRVPVPGLPVHDPFRRIRPRMPMPTGLPVGEILSEALPTGGATLHGDLHVGQFIRDPRGMVWIVDLDDMAMGPPEADLANFAAHLATASDGHRIAHWAARVAEAWTGLGQDLDGEVLARFLRVSLLRRHLKLREAGRPDFEAQISDYLRDSSNFSIR